MPVLPTALEPRSETFRANEAAMRALVADLRDQSAAIALGGDEASRRRHEGRGKLLARSLVRTEGEEFLELIHDQKDGATAGGLLGQPAETTRLGG